MGSPPTSGSDRSARLLPWCCRRHLRPGPADRFTRRPLLAYCRAGAAPLLQRVRRGSETRREGRPRVKFRVERDVLAEAVTWVARALPARPPVPVLAGLLLEADGEGVLRLSSFDYEVSARVEVPSEVADAGTVLVSGRLLADISRSLPGKPVDVATDGSRVALTCGASRFTLLTMPVDDYPTLPGMPPASGTIGGDEFTRAVAQVTVAASRDETLPILTGVRMEIEGERLTLLATDRYRLAMRTLPWRPAAPDTSAVALVRARTLSEVSKALGAGGRRHAGVEHGLGQRAHRLRGGRPAHDVPAGRRRVPQGASAVPGRVPRPRSGRHPPAARGRPARLARGRAEHPGATGLHGRRGDARGRPGRGRPGVRGRRVRPARRGPVDRLQPAVPARRPGGARARRSPGSRSRCRRSPRCSPGRPRSRARTTTATGTCSCPCASRASPDGRTGAGTGRRIGPALPACPAINSVAGLAPHLGGRLDVPGVDRSPDFSFVGQGPARTDRGRPGRGDRRAHRTRRARQDGRQHARAAAQSRHRGHGLRPQSRDQRRGQPRGAGPGPAHTTRSCG